MRPHSLIIADRVVLVPRGVSAVGLLKEGGRLGVGEVPVGELVEFLLPGGGLAGGVIPVDLALLGVGAGVGAGGLVVI